MTASCLGLGPPAAMIYGWFPHVQAVSSADLCNAFLEHHDHAFLLGARWRRPLRQAYIFHPCDVVGPAQLHLKQDGLYAEGRLALLRTSSFDTWSCQLMPRIELKQRWLNCSSSLVCFHREARSLHRTGEWERRQPGIPGFSWRDGVTLQYSLWQCSKGTASFGQAVVKTLADSGITGDDTSQVSEVFHYV